MPGERSSRDTVRITIGSLTIVCGYMFIVSDGRMMLQPVYDDTDGGSGRD